MTKNTCNGIPYYNEASFYLLCKESKKKITTKTRMLLTRSETISTDQVLRTSRKFSSSWIIFTANRQIRWTCKPFGESLTFPMPSCNLQDTQLGSFPSLDTVESNQTPRQLPGTLDSLSCPIWGWAAVAREPVSRLALPAGCISGGFGSPPALLYLTGFYIPTGSCGLAEPMHLKPVLETRQKAPGSPVNLDLFLYKHLPCSSSLGRMSLA